MLKPFPYFSVYFLYSSKNYHLTEDFQSIKNFVTLRQYKSLPLSQSGQVPAPLPWPSFGCVAAAKDPSYKSLCSLQRGMVS